MRRIDAARVGGLLLGLMGIAYVGVIAGRATPTDEMKASNYGGAGTSALAELLRRNGYSVRVEERTNARFAADEVSISFHSLGFVSQIGPEPVDEEVESVGKRGGRAVLFFRAPETGSDVRDEATGSVRPSRAAVKVASGSSESMTLGHQQAIVDGAQALIAYATSDPANAIVLPHGEIALNHRLGLERNADVVLGVVRAADKSGSKRVVFWEGNEGKGLLDALGPWAHAARNQLLFALLTLGVFLSSRFGLAPTPRRRQTGSRETADALGNLLLRWRGPAIGIESGLEAARRRLVKARRLPASAPREQWPKYLSPATLMAIAELESTDAGARSTEVLGKVRALDAVVELEIAGVYRTQ